VLVAQFDWLYTDSSGGVLALFTSGRKQNVFLFCSGYRREHFLLNEAGVPPNTKKAAKFGLITVCTVEVFSSKLFLMNEIIPKDCSQAEFKLVIFVFLMVC
jgi:hypothetical protein